MSDHYRPGLNRFIPAIVPGHALLVPNPILPGKFRVVDNGERFASSAVLKTRPIGKLVDLNERLPWNAPTVVYESRNSEFVHTEPPQRVAASDYRYIQRVARDRTALPVLNVDNGRIYNLAPMLRAIDLLDYGRLLRDAARYSMYDAQRQSGPSAYPSTSPGQDPYPPQTGNLALAPVVH